MKKYIQITAGRGPVECARAVALVARELIKAIPALQLADCEPHNQEGGCFMSMTLVTEEVIPHSFIQEWEGTILWRSTANPYRPDTSGVTGLSAYTSLMTWNCHGLMNQTSFMKRAVQEVKAVRMSTK